MYGWGSGHSRGSAVAAAHGAQCTAQAALRLASVPPRPAPPCAGVLSGAALLGHLVQQLDLADEDVSGLITLHHKQMHQQLALELNFSAVKKGPRIPPLEPRIPQLGSFATHVRACVARG